METTYLARRNRSKSRIGKLLCFTTLLVRCQAWLSPALRWPTALTPPRPRIRLSTDFPTATTSPTYALTSPSPSSTALKVWWFGGTETLEQQSDQDECELVAVRIERTSPNSRRIMGEIVSPTPMDDVWAILTDYNRLALHVPNLMESRILQENRGSSSNSRNIIGSSIGSTNGVQGDGTYQCKLFQRGAQKIVGFEFGASLTMDMKEQIFGPNERKIAFRCVDSMFFSEFDGEWRVKQRQGADGQPETLLSYTVDVRPNGPVPVAALEWRIREDVPTNLRAVKRAAVQVGFAGVMAHRKKMGMPPLPMSQSALTSTALSGDNTRVRQDLSQSVRRSVVWESHETLAAYLKE